MPLSSSLTKTSSKEGVCTSAASISAPCRARKTSVSTGPPRRRRGVLSPPSCRRRRARLCPGGGRDVRAPAGTPGPTDVPSELQATISPPKASRGSSRGDHPSTREQPDPVAAAGLLDVPGAHDDRPPLVAQGLEAFPELVAQDGVQVRGGLVHEHQLRPVHRSGGELKPPLHPPETFAARRLRELQSPTNLSTAHPSASLTPPRAVYPGDEVQGAWHHDPLGGHRARAHPEADGCLGSIHTAHDNPRPVGRGRERGGGVGAFFPLSPR